jgi:hypothetical protein
MEMWKMIEGKRIYGDEYFGGSLVSFDSWGGFNEHEKLAAKVFEEAIENTLAEFPPYMSILSNKEKDDLLITFTVSGLADGDDGPTWQFSVRDHLDSLLNDVSNEDAVDMLDTLIALVKFFRAKIVASPRQIRRA